MDGYPWEVGRKWYKIHCFVASCMSTLKREYDSRENLWRLSTMFQPSCPRRATHFTLDVYTHTYLTDDKGNMTWTLFPASPTASTTQKQLPLLGRVNCHIIVCSSSISCCRTTSPLSRLRQLPPRDGYQFNAGTTICFFYRLNCLDIWPFQLPSHWPTSAIMLL
jgi:hypothetical protein